jgi:hypothetical protein
MRFRADPDSEGIPAAKICPEISENDQKGKSEVCDEADVSQ